MNTTTTGLSIAPKTAEEVQAAIELYNKRASGMINCVGYNNICDGYLNSLGLLRTDVLIEAIKAWEKKTNYDRAVAFIKRREGKHSVSYTIVCTHEVVRDSSTIVSGGECWYYNASYAGFSALGNNHISIAVDNSGCIVKFVDGFAYIYLVDSFKK